MYEKPRFIDDLDLPHFDLLSDHVEQFLFDLSQAGFEATLAKEVVQHFPDDNNPKTSVNISKIVVNSSTDREKIKRFVRNWRPDES